MPRGDNTGPNGAGPMTGRGAGFCAGNNMAGYAAGGSGRGMGYGRKMGFGRGFGRGIGRGFGGGRGFGAGIAYAYPAVTGDEKEILKTEAATLENELKAVQNRLSELKKPESK